MEGVFLPGFGDVGLEGPIDIGCDEQVASAEVVALAALLLNTREGGVSPQRGGDLPAVFDYKQSEVAVALLEHEVVCLPDLFRGSTEGQPGIGEPWFGEGGICAILLAVFFGLGSLEVGGDSGAPGRVVGQDERSFLSVGSFINYSVTGATENGQRCE